MTGFSKQNNDQPFFLGVTGGSGSGKTYFAQCLQKKLGPDICEIIFQDNFYIDQSKRFDYDGGSVNFDHPSSLDFGLLAKHIEVLKSGQTTEIPTYDFVTHSRKKETVQIKPKKIIIVDGILIAHAIETRFLFNELIYFDTPEDLRYSRRLERDVQERGRDPAGVKNQFIKQVKPMHDEFVEPSKVFATTIICNDEDFQKALNRFLS